MTSRISDGLQYVELFSGEKGHINRTNGTMFRSRTPKQNISNYFHTLVCVNVLRGVLCEPVVSEDRPQGPLLQSYTDK